MRNIAGALILVATAAGGQPPPTVELRHLYTFGSKHGIHPPTVLNRRAATVPLGKGDNPYGLVFPVAVATDVRRRVWIADSGTALVHVLDPATGSYREIRRLGDTPLLRPAGIAVDGAGRIFLADSEGGRVFVFDETGEFDHLLWKRRERPVESPAAVAISEDQKTVYVADPLRNVVVALNREGEVNGTIRLPLEFGEPEAISVVDNQIYVLGSRQRRVGIFSPAGALRGERRWDGIRLPAAVTYDASRRRFLVANPRWMIVEVFDGEGRSLGSFGRSGAGVDQMERIDFLYVDPQGLHYLVDSPHGKVLVFGDSACVPR